MASHPVLLIRAGTQVGGDNMMEALSGAAWQSG